MPILSKTGRRSFKSRALVLSMYILLFVGAITMVYPFLLMIAGSTKTAADTQESVIIPTFLTDRAALYRKHIEGLFNESLNWARDCYDIDAIGFDKLDPPANPNRAFVEQWKAFLKETKPSFEYWGLGYLSTPMSRGAQPKNLRDFRRQMEEKYHSDVGAMNLDLGTEVLQWWNFGVVPEDYSMRRAKPVYEPFDLAYRAFKITRPLEDRYYFSIEGVYKTEFLKTQYTKDIAAYNKAHDTKYASYDQVHLARRLHDSMTAKEKSDWTEFARTLVNLFWVRADATAAPFYREFLKAKYRAIDALNEKYATKYATFDDVPLIDVPPTGGLVLSDWDSFIQGWKDPDAPGKVYSIPAEMLRISSLDFQFRDWLKAKFESVEKANAALGTNWRDWIDAFAPQREYHYLSFLENVSPIRSEFITRNYRSVFDYLVRHGRGVSNTAIYCTLSILAALIVNPLAAYALSRYKPPSTYKVLLFLMLTMAFPPMVTQIPVFLMLRDFHLLNSFWALILPGLANGYSIFLLKGFFDSLPHELYESAELDGAGEERIFWQITMSLSTPILAVIALGAFTGAYSSFIFALLICQDERMWTLMVWLYQLQSRSGPGIVFASLILAAIPTFVVFVLCQNVIMKGIVVPVEK